MQSAQFPTFQAISIFLQIRLDGSNCHIFPAMLYSNEVKNRGGRAGISMIAPYNFLHFSQQYTVHIMARREKNRAEFFSCMRVRIRFNEFSPSNICLYTIAAALRKQTGQAWRLESTTGIYYLG